MTGRYRGPVHNNCNINVTPKQSNFIPFVFHSFGIYDYHPFFKKFDNKENDKVKLEILPKTNEERVSERYGFFKIY